MRRPANRLIVLFAAALVSGCNPDPANAPPAETAPADPGVRPEFKARTGLALKKKKKEPGNARPRESAVKADPNL